MKIDVSKIDGYAEMTPEEKSAALEAYELDIPADNSTELEKLKAAVSKANGEAAEYKKQLRERMTETEKAEAERQSTEAEREATRKAADEAREQELSDLRQRTAIYEHKTRLLGLGYSDKLATDTATALASGDMDKVFKNQSDFIATREAAIRAENVKNMPVTEHKEPTDKEPYIPPAII